MYCYMLYLPWKSIFKQKSFIHGQCTIVVRVLKRAQKTERLSIEVLRATVSIKTDMVSKWIPGSSSFDTSFSTNWTAKTRLSGLISELLPARCRKSITPQLSANSGVITEKKTDFSSTTMYVCMDNELAYWLINFKISVKPCKDD